MAKVTVFNNRSLCKETSVTESVLQVRKGDHLPHSCFGHRFNINEILHLTQNAGIKKKD